MPYEFSKLKAPTQALLNTIEGEAQRIRSELDRILQRSGSDEEVRQGLIELLRNSCPQLSGILEELKYPLIAITEDGTSPYDCSGCVVMTDKLNREDHCHGCVNDA